VPDFPYMRCLVLIYSTSTAGKQRVQVASKKRKWQFDLVRRAARSLRDAPTGSSQLSSRPKSESQGRHGNHHTLDVCGRHSMQISRGEMRRLPVTATSTSTTMLRFKFRKWLRIGTSEPAHGSSAPSSPHVTLACPLHSMIYFPCLFLVNIDNCRRKEDLE
jgi:hypothetical protein